MAQNTIKGNAKLQKLFKYKWDHRLDVGNHEFPDDLDKITDIVFEKFGVMISGVQANEIWKWYSEHFYCATWMQVDEHGIEEAFNAWIAQH